MEHKSVVNQTNVSHVTTESHVCDIDYLKLAWSPQLGLNSERLYYDLNREIMFEWMFVR